MAEHLKLKVGGCYLTRDGRISTSLRPVEGAEEYPFEGYIDGGREVWRADGTWSWQEGQDDELDLVSEYAEPAAVQEPNEPRYRYFRYAEPDQDPRHTCVWRHAAGDRYCTAKYVYRADDDWDETRLRLEDDILFAPYMIECDENGVPLPTQPAEQEFEEAKTTLTPLEICAMSALSALLSNPGCLGLVLTREEFASSAFDYAEALLAESRIRNGGARA